jgi:hypothetical protein
MIPNMKADDYRPVSRKRRLLIALLAVATAVTIVLTLVSPPAGSRGPHPLAQMPDAAACGPGQTTDCVGGRADVFLVAPTAVAAPAANDVARPAGPPGPAVRAD